MIMRKKYGKKVNLNIQIGSSYEDYMNQSTKNKFFNFSNKIDEDTLL